MVHNRSLQEDNDGDNNDDNDDATTTTTTTTNSPTEHTFVTKALIRRDEVTDLTQQTY